MTGARRVHQPHDLEAQIPEKGINPASPGIKEYLEVFIAKMRSAARRLGQNRYLAMTSDM